MSISSSTRKAGPYSCNGSTVAFPFAFKVFTTADVRVVLTDANAVESDLVLGTNYTVALNADQDANPGGTVTTTATYATGYKVTLTSQVQALQPVTLTNQGGFYPKIINDALDRVTIMVQQLSEQVSRAVKTSISSNTSPDSLISTLLTAVSNALTYSNNASSSATAAAGSASAASASAAAAAASAAALPNATGNANTVPVVNGAGNGWLMKTAAQMLSFLGLGVANQASGVVVLDASSKLPAVDGSQLTGISALPTQTGNTNKVLKTNGTAAAWDSAGTLGTAANTTSGSAIDFTGIPSWVKRITIMLNGAVSTSGTSNLQVQIGSGSIDTTGYTSTAQMPGLASSSTTGFLLTAQLNSGADTHRAVMTLVHFGGNLWLATVLSSDVGNNVLVYGTGVKTALSGALDRVRITTVGGTDTFDAGSINILYE